MLFKKRFSKKALLRLGIIITGLTLVIIAVVTYYGQNVGNFVIAIDDDAFNKTITLSDTKEFIYPRIRLVCDPISDARDMTYPWIAAKLPRIENTDGIYLKSLSKDEITDENRFIAYTFYMKNSGSETVDVKMSFSFYDVTKNIDKAIRVFVVKTIGDERTEKLYMAPDTQEYEYIGMPAAIKFVNESTILEDKIIGFYANSVAKFTILIWLEGEDPDCTDSVASAKIKFRLQFIAIGTEE